MLQPSQASFNAAAPRDRGYTGLSPATPALAPLRSHVAWQSPTSGLPSQPSSHPRQQQTRGTIVDSAGSRIPKPVKAKPDTPASLPCTHPPSDALKPPFSGQPFRMRPLNPAQAQPGRTPVIARTTCRTAMPQAHPGQSKEALAPLSDQACKRGPSALLRTPCRSKLQQGTWLPSEPMRSVSPTQVDSSRIRRHTAAAPPTPQLPAEHESWLTDVRATVALNELQLSQMRASPAHRNTAGSAISAGLRGCAGRHCMTAARYTCQLAFWRSSRMLAACQPGYPKSPQEPLSKNGCKNACTLVKQPAVLQGWPVESMFTGCTQLQDTSQVCCVSLCSADCQSWEVLACWRRFYEEKQSALIEKHMIGSHSSASAFNLCCSMSLSGSQINNTLKSCDISSCIVQTGQLI